MSQSTILLAIKEFVDTHPSFPEDYFSTSHRMATGFWGNKVYLVREENGWALVELNFLHLLMRQFSSILNLGHFESYGNIAMNSFRSEMHPLPYDENISNQVKHLYEGLMTKALGPDRAWTDKVNNDLGDLFDEQSQPLIEHSNRESLVEIDSTDEQSPLLMKRINQEKPVEIDIVDKRSKPVMEPINQESQVETDAIDMEPLSLMEILNKESQEKNSAVRNIMQKKTLAIAKANYKDFFHNIDQMTNEQRASLIRLLSSDVKLSLGIWNGIMHHGKAFQLSTREKVSTWILTIIQALTLEQLKEACKDSKFWEVVGLFHTEVGAALSLEQWTCIIENNKESDLIVKLMLSLPVNELLYDKLLVACGRIPIDFGKELGMKMLISRLNRYLKAQKDERSTDVLTQALKKAPPRMVTAPTPLNNKAPHSVTQPNLRLTAEKELPRPASVYVTPVKHPRPPQWKDEDFYNTVNNLSQNVGNLEKAQILFWQLLGRFLKEANTEEQNHCQKSLKYLIRYYPDSVFGQIDGLNEHELQLFLTALEQTDPALIIGVWDALMGSARELGFSNELFARNKAQRILKHVSPQQLAASVFEDKLWAVLRHYSDLAGLLFSAAHLKVLVPGMRNPEILAKIISDLPLNDDLGDKLAVICPHMVKDTMLEMQMAAKILWYSAHVNKNEASELQRIIDGALHAKGLDENTTIAFSFS
jgi:hypothetical protein